MGNAFTSGYLPVNFWVREAWKTPILLAGYWEDCPHLMAAIVVESVLQIVLGVLGVISILYPVLNLKIFNGPWSFDILPETFPLGIYVIIPLLTAFWEISLGAMHLSVVYTWFGAPFMSTVYIHSQLELYLLVYRLLLMNGLDYNRKHVVVTLISTTSWSVVTLLTYMSTSNLGVQGSVAGTSFLTDFALVLGIPITSVVMYTRFKKMNIEETGQEGLLTGLCLIHIFQYYIHMFMVLIDDSATTIRISGIFLTTFAYINLVVYGFYMFVTFRSILSIHNRVKQIHPLGVTVEITPQSSPSGSRIAWGEQRTPGHSGQNTPKLGNHFFFGPAYSAQNTPKHGGTQRTPAHSGRNTPKLGTSRIVFLGKSKSQSPSTSLENLKETKSFSIAWGENLPNPNNGPPISISRRNSNSLSVSKENLQEVAPLSLITQDLEDGPSPEKKFVETFDLSSPSPTSPSLEPPPSTIPWYHVLYYSSGVSHAFLWFMVGLSRNLIAQTCPQVNSSMRLQDVLLAQMVVAAAGFVSHLGMCAARYYAYKFRGQKPKTRAGIGSLVLLCNVIGPLVMFPWVGYVAIGLFECAGYAHGSGFNQMVSLIVAQVSVFIILLLLFIYRYYAWVKRTWSTVFFTLWNDVI